MHDAVDGVVDLVDEGHESTARTVVRATDPIAPIGDAVKVVDRIRRFSTRGVLGSIKMVNRIVQAASDAGIDAVEAIAAAPDPSRALVDDTARAAAPELEPAVPMRSDAMMSAAIVGDATLGLVNGFVGDRLFARANGLDLGLALRIRDHYVDPTREEGLREGIAAAFAAGPKPPGARVAVFAHGLATTEWSWVLEAQNYHGDPSVTFGVLLERDLGITPVYVRYNTGRHISTNGRALAGALDALVRNYPVPIEELVLIGHSMGGLVSRSACHYGAEASMPWVPLVKRVFALGSPHEGAPVEKLGFALASALGSIDLPGTRITAEILERRSAGIRDLRFGSLVEADWWSRDPDAVAEPKATRVPLLPHIAYHFVSATVTRDPDHPLGRLVGDSLVRVSSGEAASMVESHFPIERTRFGGILHHQLQNHPDVYEVIRKACATRVKEATT